MANQMKNKLLTESEKLELKKSTSELKEAVVSIVAILNKCQKGELYFGIRNDGEVVGQTVTEKTIRDISQAISDQIEPKIFPQIKEIILAGKKCVYVGFSGKDIPYYAHGRAYVRVGEEDKKISPQELERLILKKNKSKIGWDEEICERAVWDDIDEEKVKWFVKEARKQRNLNLEEDLSIKEALMRLKLLKNNRLTNTIILLFGKEPQKFFLQTEIKCIRFKGTGVTEEMIDFKVIEGDIISQLKKTEDFIFEHISKKAWIEEGKLQRQEKWLYPPKAIREALANTLTHRDYESPSKIQVRIFDDRIEFWNPGKLPEGWTVEKLKEKHESKPFNPLIAKQFFWIRYIEEVGTGTNKIIEWCVNWGLPEPEFEFTGTSVVVTFKKPFAKEELLKQGLNERQIRAVEYVVKKGSITNKEYQKLTGAARETVTRDLAALIKKNILRKIGRGKRGIKYLLRHNDAKMTQKENKNVR